MKLMNHKAFGDQGEALAKQYLEDKGYKILQENYRTKIGEIDLIVTKEHQLVFVEVKTRRSRNYGKGFEAVNFKKQQTLQRVATQYLAYQKNNIKSNLSMRFDVMDIFIKGDDVSFDHIENAF